MPASPARMSSCGTIRLDAWRSVFAVNLHGPFNCCRAVVPHMRERNYGRIVNIASVAGKDGNPNASAYSASKAAVIALTKSLGKELADTEIRVNCVTPAAVRTPMFAQMTQAHIDYMLSKIPMGRFGEPQEIAAMVAWLAQRGMLIQHRRGVRPLRRTINVLRNQLLGSNASHGLTALVDETVRQRKFSDCIALPPLAALTMCPTCHAASVSNSATMLPPPPNRVVLAFRSLSTPLWGSGMWPPVPLLRGSLASLSAGLLPVLSPPFSQRRSSTLRRNYARIDKPGNFTSPAPAPRWWRRSCRPPKRRDIRSAPPRGPSPRATSHGHRAASAGSASARARRSSRE